MSKFDMEMFREGYHDHGAVRCEVCESRVDLSEASNVDEALDIWNAHVRGGHET